MKAMFKLRSEQVRNAAINAIKHAPESYIVEIKQESRSAAQNRHFHALFACFNNLPLHGKLLNTEQWKACLFEAFCKLKKDEDGEIISGYGTTVPSLDGSYRVSIRPSTTTLNKKQCAEFIEYIYAYGSDRGIQWTVNAMQIIDEYGVQR